MSDIKPGDKVRIKASGPITGLYNATVWEMVYPENSRVYSSAAHIELKSFWPLAEGVVGVVVESKVQNQDSVTIEHDGKFYVCREEDVEKLENL